MKGGGTSSLWNFKLTDCRNKLFWWDSSSAGMAIYYNLLFFQLFAQWKRFRGRLFIFANQSSHILGPWERLWRATLPHHASPEVNRNHLNTFLHKFTKNIFSRSSRPSQRGTAEPNDSGSSGEEDDDDGFEILTAENLFSTLLSRVHGLMILCWRISMVTICVPCRFEHSPTD